MHKNPYQVLGVSPNATDDEIKQAYRRLAKKYHPDLHPGDKVAAQKMQEINAAYEQIKNPEKAASNAGSGAHGYDPFGGSYGKHSQQENADRYQAAAEQYVHIGRYHEALNTLLNSQNRNARWYYISALAHNGLDNQVTALEHIRKAVSMDPDNFEYLQALTYIQHSGTAYRQHAGEFRGFQMRGTPCASLLLCWFASFFCCRGGPCG